MTTARMQHNLKLASRWYEEMWSLPAPEVADEIVAPDYAPSWIHIPKQGPAQVQHEIRYFRSVFPDLVYTVVDTIADDEKVWIRYRGQGTQDGAAWGFPATGKSVSFEGATTLTVNGDGMIIDRWGAFSFFDILVDLGLTPPLWELNKALNL